jgi:hypothetical protein
MNTLGQKVPGEGQGGPAPKGGSMKRTQTFAIPSNQQMKHASANPVSLTRVTTRHDFA